MTDTSDKLREEFFSEAQELVEAFARNLLAMDAAEKSGSPQPGLVNEAFRAVHTLKSLAGLFGAKQMATLAHQLEDVLDGLRLGKLPLRADVLDVLFVAIDVLGQVLAAEKTAEGLTVAAAVELSVRIAALGSAPAAVGEPAEVFQLDPGLLGVLTEYEEHRLRENVHRGMSLFRLRVSFALVSIDTDLEALKEAAKPLGEVITYLPSGGMSHADEIELDLLLASERSLAELRAALADAKVEIQAIERRGASSGMAAPTIAPSVPPHPIIRLTAEPPGASLVPPRAPELEAGEGAEGGHAEPGAIRAVAQTVRVDIRRLDALMNVVGELAIVKSSLARLVERVRGEGHRQLASELQRVHRSFDRRLSELQDGILEVRMVPLGQVFDRLARVVRQMSREVGKEVRLVITGAETEIDKLIVEEFSDPLMHVVRNAIDHGLEAPERRAALGKPDAGTLALNAFQKGNHVVVEVEDDGGGIAVDALRARAAASGKLSEAEAAALSHDEALALIFVPGLSTREVAGDFSGRGVGMDVVKTNIAKLGGVIDVQSEHDIGTKITITLPVTLAIVRALLVRVRGRTFAIPLASVREALSFDVRAVRVVDRREVMTLRGATLPLCRLANVFGFPVAAGTTGERYVVVTALGNRRLGLVVSELLGQQDIVIKPLGASIAAVRGFAGATELGDQRVALVIDAATLIEDTLGLAAEVLQAARLHAHG